MVTGSTHESMGFTRLSLFKLELEVDNFSAGDDIGELKLAGVTGTSRSSVSEGGTTTGVASSSLLGYSDASSATHVSLCLLYRPFYTSSHSGIL